MFHNKKLIDADDIVIEFEEPEPNQLWPGSVNKPRRDKVGECE
jgi:hypothetical protein